MPFMRVDDLKKHMKPKWLLVSTDFKRRHGFGDLDSDLEDDSNNDPNNDSDNDTDHDSADGLGKNPDSSTIDLWA